MTRKLPLCAAVSAFALASCKPKTEGPDVDYHIAAMGADLNLHRDPALSPDGTRLAYSMGIEGRSAIYVAAAGGSNPVRLTHGVWDQSPYWSPDGRWIAYYSDEGADIWVVPSAGGPPRQLTSGPENDDVMGWLHDGSGVLLVRHGAGPDRTLVVPVEGGPVRPLVDVTAGNVYAFPSPDGTKVGYILVAGGRSTLWVQDVAGGAPRQLTTEGLEDVRLNRMWSPDSRHIVYNSRRTGTQDLWVADVDSSTLRQLTTDIHDDYGATWSPDGRWLLFESNRGGQEDQWIVPAAGGPERRATSDIDLEDFTQWSPDGHSIVYGTMHLVSAIEVRPVAGGAPHTVVSLEGYGFGNNPIPAISPDGTTLLFTSNRSGALDIWSVPVAGGEITQFAASPTPDTWPEYSPDGRWVAFYSNRRGTFDLWVAPAAGGEPRRLTDWPSAEVEPRWSPDGSTIAFVSNRDVARSEVWTIPAEGGTATRVTHGNFGADIPRWSPDGRTIYFVGAAPDGSNQLFAVPAAGGTARALSRATGGASVNDLFDVSPDGAQVAYIVMHAGYAHIEVVPSAGGAPRRMTADSAVYQFGPRWSPDGRRIEFLDWNFATNLQHVAFMSWPEGTIERPTTPGTFQDLPALWTPDGQSLIIPRSQQMVRIVTADVSRLLAAQP